MNIQNNQLAVSQTCDAEGFALAFAHLNELFKLGEETGHINMQNCTNMFLF